EEAALRPRAIVEIDDLSPGRNGGAERLLITARAVIGTGRIHIRAGDAQMVEAVTAPLDRLAIDGRVVVQRLDQLDQHMAGEAHGQGDVGGARFPAINLAGSDEIIEHEERARRAYRRPSA